MVSLDGVKELDICTADGEINLLLNYINRYFSDTELFNAQYENSIKLSNYVKRNNIIIGENKLIAAVGVDNLIVVETEDALLVCAKDRAQDVKEVVAMLEKTERKHLL